MRWWLPGLLALLAFAGCDDEAGSGGTGQRGDAAVRDQTDGGTSGGPCSAGEAICDAEGRRRTCLEDETGWLVEACPALSRCESGDCVELACDPGSRACSGDAVQTCRGDGTAWGDPVPCAAGASCLDGVCLPRSCAAGETACADKVLLTCAEDGLQWARTPCEADERCVDGACVAGGGGGSCPPGQVLCGPEGIFACGEDGTSWVERPCAEGEACFDGACVRCLRDSDCPAGSACVAGDCGPPPLAILPQELPPGQVEVAYLFRLEAANGTAPYAWTLLEGELPPGMLFFDNGTLDGTPRAAGRFAFRVAVEDADGGRAEAAFELVIHGEGLVITTNSPLRRGEEGEAYSVRFEAIGGTPPYGWLVVDGALPEGLVLTADGNLSGTPSEVGRFEFTMRAVDAANPAGFAEKDFVLEIAVAPLRIVGDQSFDLFITRVVVLPTITVIQNLPIPYETRLLARGGLRPYRWSEVPLDANLQRFIPMSGIPEGLQLDEDGRLHGAVDDTGRVIELQIPFTQIRLTGFFFVGEVRDSQAVADSAQAIFLLPTIPLGGN